MHVCPVPVWERGQSEDGDAHDQVEEVRQRQGDQQLGEGAALLVAGQAQHREHVAHAPDGEKMGGGGVGREKKVKARTQPTTTPHS